MKVPAQSPVPEEVPQERTYILAPMQSDDVPAVSELERRCFTNPWPQSAYYRELREPERNFYIVLRHVTGDVPLAEPEAEPRGPLALLPRLLRPSRPTTQPIVGFAGMWIIYGEAHVTTIAVAPEHRGLGLGEVLFLTLVSEAVRRNAEFVTLEVRVSNVTAQRLYEKYGLTRQGLRRHYYSDNGEDAYIMTSPSLRDPAYRATLLALREQLMSRLSTEGIAVLEQVP